MHLLHNEVGNIIKIVIICHQIIRLSYSSSCRLVYHNHSPSSISHNHILGSVSPSIPKGYLNSSSLRVYMVSCACLRELAFVRTCHFHTSYPLMITWFNLCITIYFCGCKCVSPNSMSLLDVGQIPSSLWTEGYNLEPLFQR